MHLFNPCAKSLLVFLLIAVSLIPSSIMIPLPLYLRIKKSIEPEPIYVPQEDIQGLDGGGSQDLDQGLEERSELTSAIDADTSETLRKINPLTIANQVSNLLRKGNEGSTSTNQQPIIGTQNENLPENMERSGVLPSVDSKDSSVRNGVMNNEAFLRTLQKNNPSPISSPQRSSAMESESSGSVKSAEPASGKSGESPEGYIHQEIPKIVNKPIPKDSARYSVIVMAGDAVKFPIHVDSKPKKSQQQQESEVKEDCSSGLGPVVSGPSRVDASGNLRRGEAETSKRLREKSSKKESRVSKQYGKYPDFPVYDEDFNFVPDPLQGVLDENYWKEVDKNGVQKLAVPMESYKIGEFGFEPHNILMRSNENNGEKVQVNDRIQACGGSGTCGKKSNNTEIVTD